MVLYSELRPVPWPLVLTRRIRQLSFRTSTKNDGPMRHLITCLCPLLLTGCLAFGAGAAGGAVAAGGGDDQVEYYINTESPPDSIASAMRAEKVIEGMTEPQARLTVQAMRRYKDEPTREVDLPSGGKRLYYVDTHFGPGTIITFGLDGRVTKAETKRQEDIDLPQ